MAKKQVTKEKNTKVRLTGTVVSDKMTGTAVVTVDRALQHPLYHKTVIKSKKYTVHNGLNAKMGDTVQIEEIKPISKNKRFAIIRIFEKASTIIPELQEESDLELLLSHDKEEETEEGEQTEEATA